MNLDIRHRFFSLLAKHNATLHRHVLDDTISRSLVILNTEFNTSFIPGENIDNCMEQWIEQMEAERVEAAL